MPEMYCLVNVFLSDFEVHERTVAVSFSKEALKDLYELQYNKEFYYSTSIVEMEGRSVPKTVQLQVPFANNQEEINEFEDKDIPHYFVRSIDHV